MEQALYRRYRSKALSEVIGQDHITKTLGKAIKNNNFSHAYLLTGPRGVGKTSVARIIAHNVNGLEYKNETSHLDIIEIDAASNRRIDEIRELRDKIYNAPTNAKYKVYIIDEVHMLTREAFNALLKTLEEPPAHVLFILATTEAHKVPETIISRTQQFHFKPVSQNEVAAHLLSIAKKEGIKLEPDAAKILAKHGEGSFRDSIGFLEQAAMHDKLITIESASDLLGIAPEAAIIELLSAISHKNAGGVIDTLDLLYVKGVDASQISKQLITSIRHEMIVSSFPANTDTMLSLTKELLCVPMSSDPTVMLEVTLVSFALNGNVSKSSSASEPVDSFKKTIDNQGTKPNNKDTTPIPKNNTNEIWQSVLEELKSSHNTLHSFAKIATPHYDGKTLRLVFQYPFHQKRLNETVHKSLIATIIKDKTGDNVQVLCEVNDSPTNTLPKQNEQALKNISNIFGGVEVIDS